jgi:8-oxo-dGTP pyrophosphatase MutT (NUDIX family)
MDASPLDRALHSIFRIGYVAQLAWWRIRHPSLQGAAVAVWHDGRVLVIRNSYRKSLRFPAGGIAGREHHRAAAARELREEVGIAVPPETLEYVGEFLEVTEYAADHVHLYSLHCGEAPSVQVDGREVVHAEFLTPAEAMERGVVGIYRRYLSGALGRGYAFSRIMRR